MKFTGICLVCNEKIEANEVGLWAKGIGVKHEKCAQTNELQCIVCGGSAGCEKCEFLDDCDLEKVSQLCICKKCSESTDPYSAYLNSANKRFPLLNPKTSS